MYVFTTVKQTNEQSESNPGFCFALFCTVNIFTRF